MDYKEALMLSQYPEQFDEVDVNVSEVMENEKQLHMAQELFEKLVAEKDYVNARKICWFMWFTGSVWQFND